MSTTLPTALLQELVGRAVKACTMIDKIPLTCLMEIKVSNNKLTISTTDNTNQLVLESQVQAPDFCAVVNSKMFSTLVSKLPSVNCELIKEENKLIVKTNTGKYDIDIIVDPSGSDIKFEHYNIVTDKPITKITGDAIKSILTFNKICKANNKELPSIYNYYADNNRVITYDFFKICNNPVILVNDKVCIPPAVIELLPSVCDDNGLNITIDGNDIQAFSSLGRLYGKLATEEDLNTFPVGDILKCFDDKIPYTCKINKNLILGALDRISLFINEQNNQLTLTFKNNELSLSSKKTGSYEIIPYLNPLTDNINEVTLDVDLKLFKDILNAGTEDTLIINFGIPTGIELTNNNISILLSTLMEV